MIKLNYDKMNINVNKLHDELGDLGETYFLTHDDAQVVFMFRDIEEKVSEVEETPIVTYKKRTESDEGVESWVDFDLEPIKARIAEAIANHDPTPKKPPVSDNEKLWDAISYLLNN